MTQYGLKSNLPTKIKVMNSNSTKYVLVLCYCTLKYIYNTHNINIHVKEIEGP